jgi:hypothetical protein
METGDAVIDIVYADDDNTNNINNLNHNEYRGKYYFNHFDNVKYRIKNMFQYFNLEIKSSSIHDRLSSII